MDQKCLIFVFLGWNLKIILSYLISALSNLCKINFLEKQKYLNLGSKMPNLHIFDQRNLFLCYWARILKNDCHIWNQHPRICLIAKFCEKTKMSKFGTKSALFGYFWGSILENYCLISNRHVRLCLTAKFFEETEMAKLANKIAIFGYFKPKMYLVEFSSIKFLWLQNFWEKNKSA